MLHGSGASVLHHAKENAVDCAGGFALFLRAGLTVLYACLTYQNIHLVQILIHTVLPEMLATAIAGLCLYFPLMLFCKKIKT